jgi:hypothetical protein
VDIEGDALAGFEQAAVAGGDDGALLGLLFRAIGDEQTAGGGFGPFQAFNEHTIVQRAQVHQSTPSSSPV